MGPTSLQGPNILSPMRSLLGGFTVYHAKLSALKDLEMLDYGDYWHLHDQKTY